MSGHKEMKMLGSPPASPVQRIQIVGRQVVQGGMGTDLDHEENGIKLVRSFGSISEHAFIEVGKGGPSYSTQIRRATGSW